MMRVLTIVFMVALLIGPSFGGPIAAAQEETRTDQACPPPGCQPCPGDGSATSKCFPAFGHRGFGLSVSFPFPLTPPATSTGMLFLNLFGQGNLTSNIFHRTEVRFPFTVSGFRADLISVRESLLVGFTPPPAILYFGSGVGTFPIIVNTVDGESGFLLSLLARMGIEVQVAPLGLFLDVVYATMPQPFLDIATGGVTPISNLELSFGAVFHF